MDLHDWLKRFLSALESIAASDAIAVTALLARRDAPVDRAGEAVKRDVLRERVVNAILDCERRHEHNADQLAAAAIREVVEAAATIAEACDTATFTESQLAARGATVTQFTAYGATVAAAICALAPERKT